jgi:hypothetical protein
MNNLFSKVADTTRKARINYLNKIGVNSTTDYDVLLDINNIINNYVLDSANVNTQATRIFHIIEFLKEVEQVPLLNEYSNLMKQIKQSSIIKQNDTSTTDKSDRYISLKELQETLINSNPYTNINSILLQKDFSRNMIKVYQDYLLMCLYVLNPALRNDFHNLKIITKASDLTKEDNFLVINARSVYIYLNEYKNSKSMGAVRIDLSNYTINIIRNLFKMYKKLKIVPTTLFNHISKLVVEPMTEDAMKKRVKFVSNQYFNIPLSINDYRHIWEIAIQNSDEYKNLNLNDRETLHKQLLHSLNTALKYNRV